MLIRLAPSGPPVANAEGGQAEVGDGFQLRMSEAGGSTNAATITATEDYAKDAGATAFATAFTAPDPNKRYAAHVEYKAEVAAAGVAAITTKIVASYDGGADELIGQSVTNLIASTPGAVFASVPMTLGSAMWTAMTAGNAGMIVRVRLVADNPNFKLAQNSGFLLTFKELL